MKIKVIDAPCGKGKTSWAIQHMNENPDTRFIFITPFLTEATRIKESCKGFVEPSNENGSKMKHLKDLLDKEENIVSTHSLFSMADEELLGLLQLGNYTLILDEVMEVVKQETISKHDIMNLVSGKWINIDEETGAVTAVNRSKEYKGKFSDIVEKARAERLIYSNGTFLIWEYPPEIFKAMREVYVLTYLFQGQMMRCYFDSNEIGYDIEAVGGTPGEYKLIPYCPDTGDLKFREFARDNINIYEGKLNDIGLKNGALSFSWYGVHNRPSNRLIKRLKDNAYNYFRHQVKGKAGDNMWTCFKDAEKNLKGKGYSKGFVQCGARATNDYRERFNLAYLINRYAQLGLKNYFQSNKIKVHEDLYAISELIQWIWRSRIRDGAIINLYLPSHRMRMLFSSWMDGETFRDYP